jgi:hypothetical protein
VPSVDRLRDANRYDLKLANGIPITFRLPFMEELVIDRLLPLSLLDDIRRRLAEGGTETEAQATAQESMEERLTDYETDFAAKQRVVARMIVSIDGEEAHLTPEETLEIPSEDFRKLVSIAIRQEPPRAEGEA